jgi:heat shock protein HslJ
MINTRIILGMVFLCSLIILAACGQQPSISIEDITWKLESYGGKENLKTLVEDTEITLEFKSAEGKFNGSGGCNNYFGGYEINKNVLTIKPPIGSTMMACPEPIMDQEQEYLKSLETVKNFNIKNGKLIISYSGNEVFVFVKK